jgi:3-oxoacyl-[acyl-carrier protein] reductase
MAKNNKSLDGITEGARVIITGASTGMGKALALKLAKDHKAKIILNGRHAETLKEAEQAVIKAGGEAYSVVGDVSENGLPEKIVAACLEKFGGIDILFNNAGLARSGKMLDLSVSDWEHVFAVNFFAPLKLSYLVLPYFVEKKAGMIVNVSSVAGKVAFPGSVCYASSKFALTGLSQGMANEFAGNGVKVITVCPGWVRTEFFEKNNVSDQKNPTLIAQRNDIPGILMRSLLSISSEEAADEILLAVKKNESAEIVLTIPGIAIERLAGVFPGVVHGLAKHAPSEYTATGAKSGADKGSESLN